jgi:hypothetical protein
MVATGEISGWRLLERPEVAVDAKAAALDEALLRCFLVRCAAVSALRVTLLDGAGRGRLRPDSVDDAGLAGLSLSTFIPPLSLSLSQ